MSATHPSFSTASWDRERGFASDGSSTEAAAGEYLVYSVTKMVISTLLLRLADRGRLRLDDSASLYVGLPELAPDITVRHLMSHSAGIPDYGGLRQYHEAVRLHPNEPWSVITFREQTLARPRLFAPGHGWSYSNPGYMLLKMLLQAVSGRGLAELVRTEICAPLGLASMRVVDAPAELRRLVPASSALLSTDGQERSVAERYHPGWVAHGVIASTATELVQFVRAVMEAKLVTPGALAQMLQIQRVPGDHAPWIAPSYGLGIMADPAFPAGPLYGHSGGGPGYSAAVFCRWDAGGPVQIECALSAGEQLPAERMVLERFGT